MSEKYIETLVGLTERVIESLGKIKLEMRSHSDVSNRDIDLLKKDMGQIISILDIDDEKLLNLVEKYEKISERQKRIEKGFDNMHKLLKWLMAIQVAVTGAGIALFMIAKEFLDKIK
jgi:hypothetical protein